MSWEAVVSSVVALFGIVVAWVQYALRAEVRRDLLVLRGDYANLDRAYSRCAADAARLGDVLQAVRSENAVLRAELSRRRA